MDKRQVKGFQTLQREHSLEKQDFFRYLHLSHYINQVIKNLTVDSNDPVLKEILRAYSSEWTKGSISRLYKGFMMKKSHSTDFIKDNWKNDGNCEISEEECYSYCEFQWECTHSHAWREFAWYLIVSLDSLWPRSRKLILQERMQSAGGCVGTTTLITGIYSGTVQ